MKGLATENSPPSEPSDADQSSMKDRLIRQSKTSFTPLHCNEPNCLLDFRSDAKAIELYDAATLWVIAKTCPSTCIRPDQSFALDLTGMLAENIHWCRSRQATTGQKRTIAWFRFRP